MKKNKGLINHGTITANNLTIGDNASIQSSQQKAVFTGNDLQEIAPLFDKLVAGLNTAALDERNKADLLAKVETVKQELSKEKPSGITVGTVFKTVLENLKHVKDVLPIGQMIWEKLAQFF